ncbi:hypothetical protein FA13DRAFT_1720656 [Coprinellus micaceus]|uniref:Uncharacterized protein n=1 Tax=Coprinellus micaceus TaxID=71717 RepID=A0A4Y7S7Y8_COPMI|nr:hypothetical protein FA13DRAFT_1720656 [Coprinellus micaceus]
MSTELPNSFGIPGLTETAYYSQKYGFIGYQTSLVLYGVSTVLFVQCVNYHIKSFRETSPSAGWVGAFRLAPIARKLHLGYVVALFVCGTIHAAANSWINIVAWNDVPLYPGGALAWAAASYGTPCSCSARLTVVGLYIPRTLADGFSCSPQAYFILGLLRSDLLYTFITCGDMRVPTTAA